MSTAVNVNERPTRTSALPPMRRLVSICERGGEGAAASASSVTYYLSSAATAAGGVQILLCDGSTAWSAELRASDLTPPRGKASADFQAKLLDGLAKGPSAALTVDSHARDAIELTWTSTLDDEAGFAYTLRQAAVLRSERAVGDGLRGLLHELASECTELQRSCVQQTHEVCRLQTQLQELDAVEARAGDLGSAERRDERRSSFLAVLNRKKRRISALEQVLESDAAGTEVHSDEGGHSEDEVDEEHIAEAPPAASASSAAQQPMAGAALDDDDDDDGDPLDLL